MPLGKAPGNSREDLGCVFFLSVGVALGERFADQFFSNILYRAQHSAFVKCLRQLGKEPESSSDTVHTQHNHAPRDRRRCHCRSEDAVRPRAFDRTAHEDITHI